MKYKQQLAGLIKAGIAAQLLLLSSTSLAAPPIIASPTDSTVNEPQVTIAPITLSNNDLRPSGAKGYRPWFENGAWQGDLIELDIRPNGSVDTDIVLDTSPPTSSGGANWSARIQFNTAAQSDPNFWDSDSGRIIIIGDNTGDSSNPFRWDQITSSQKQAIDPTASSSNASSSDILDFLRGDRSNESDPNVIVDPNVTPTSNPLRRRLSILGDIIHSPPRYVGAPNQDFNFDNYAEFALANQNRLPRVYVGANDGMLHAFDANNGNEVFAYIPSMVVGNLSRLAALPYQHTYFVDGQLATADVNFSATNAGNDEIIFPPEWHTVLVGGLGAGGKGFFALDITNTDLTDENQNSETDISGSNGLLLWEIDSTDGDIGFSYSRPTITRLNDGNWYAIFGNGYESRNGRAVLLIIDIETGIVTRRIQANSNRSNGLSSPSLIDTNNDGIADFAYAGDLDGNLWKFDLTGSSPTDWEVAFNGQPLFTLSDEQAIIAAPDIAENSGDGVLIYVGTGRAFSTAELSTDTRQALYGIIDEDIPNLSFPIQDVSTDRRVQQFNPNSFPTDGGGTIGVRTGSVNITPASFRFWKIDNVPIGELFLTQPQTRAGRVQVSSYNHPDDPNDPDAQANNWFTQPSFNDGSAPLMTIFNLNTDSVLDNQDNIGGSSNQTSIVMGIDLGAGIRSRATIAVVSENTDTAIINGLFVPEFGTCPERFADICFGAFTDLDEFNDEFQEQVDELLAELADLGVVTTREALLGDTILGDDAFNSEDFINESDTTFNPEAISNTLDDLQVSSDRLTSLVDDTKQAIDFIGNAKEDIGISNSPIINGQLTGSVQSLENLGPSYGLGRRSWVELSE